MADLFTELRAFDKMITDIENSKKKQIPYATAQALKYTAATAQSDVSKHIEQTFDVSNGWYKEGRRYGPKKTTPNKHNLRVTIYMDRPGSGQEHWIEDHESGELRRADGGRGILVPTHYFEKLFGRKKNRAAKKKAQTMLGNKKKYRVFEAPIRVGSGSNRRIGSKHGDTAIYYVPKGKTEGKRSRVGKTGRKLKPKKILNRKAFPLWIVKEEVKEKPRLEFERTIRKRFERDFNKEFYKQFDRAMANRKV